MGTGNTKLRDIQELKQSFLLQTDSIQRFDGLVITVINKADVSKIAHELWRVLSRLKVSIAEAQIPMTYTVCFRRHIPSTLLLIQTTQQ